MMIELVDVWFKYSKGSSWALRGISIGFRPGEVTVIVGPNGSGKTTLLKVASLMYEPTKGKVLVDGEEFWSLSEEKQLSIRRKFIYVHEKPIMLRSSVLENVIYGLLIRGIDRATALRYGLNMLSSLELEHLANKSARRLSAGEAQLVAIARALVLKPKIAFLDEPFAFLDREKQRRLSRIIGAMRNESVGFVVATHNPSVIRDFADRIFILESGVVVEESQDPSIIAH